MVSRSVSLPCKGFFSPFPHGTGSLSVSAEYLALPDGPGRFTLDSSCPALLRVPAAFGPLRVRASHPLRGRFPSASARSPRGSRRPYNPARASTRTVWAPPRSLAATRGMTIVLFSCGYLDVSVPRVRPRNRCGWQDRSCRVAPFGNPRIKGRLRLPAEYRRLPRPSSPRRA